MLRNLEVERAASSSHLGGSYVNLVNQTPNTFK